MASTQPIKQESPQQEYHPTPSQLRQHLESQLSKVSPVVLTNLYNLLASPRLSNTHIEFLCILFEISAKSGIFGDSVPPPLEKDLMDLHITFGVVATELLRQFVTDTLDGEEIKKAQLDIDAINMVQSIKKSYDEYMEVRRALQSGKGFEHGYRGRENPIAEMDWKYNIWQDRRRDLEGIRDEIDVVRMSLQGLADLELRFSKLA